MRKEKGREEKNGRGKWKKGPEREKERKHEKMRSAFPLIVGATQESARERRGHFLIHFLPHTWSLNTSHHPHADSLVTFAHHALMMLVRCTNFQKKDVISSHFFFSLFFSLLMVETSLTTTIFSQHPTHLVVTTHSAPQHALRHTLPLLHHACTGHTLTDTDSAPQPPRIPHFPRASPQRAIKYDLMHKNYA